MGAFKILSTVVALVNLVVFILTLLRLVGVPPFWIAGDTKGFSLQPHVNFRVPVL